MAGKLNSPAPLRAIMTVSWWSRKTSRPRRKNSRNPRFTRLRTTAFPTLELTVTPSRLPRWSLSRRMMMKCGVWNFLPLRDSSRNSERLVRRASLGKPSRTQGNGSVLGARTLGWDDDGQPLSSLGPPALQHIAPAGGLHTREKTVGSLSPKIAGLIRPFHFRTFIFECLISSTRRLPCQFAERALVLPARADEEVQGVRSLTMTAADRTIRESTDGEG